MPSGPVEPPGVEGLLAGTDFDPRHEGTLPVMLHGGAFEPTFPSPSAASGGFKPQWTDVVDEAKVLCFGCRWAWIVWKHAPVRNLKPDGSPFVAREGYCLYPAQMPGGAPIPLEERFVLKCNVFEAAKDAARMRRDAAAPGTFGDGDQP